MMFCIDVDMVGKTWIFLCENCLSLVKKKKADYQYGGTGKAKEMMEKFYNLYFICLGDNDHSISCRLDNFHRCSY